MSRIIAVAVVIAITALSAHAEARRRAGQEWPAGAALARRVGRHCPTKCS